MLSRDQERACELGRHTIVTAGAGSGKTTVLTERYLRALERVSDRPDPLRRVVALTFTEKATLEMRQRVRDGVRLRLRDASKRGDAEGVRYWRRIRQDLSAARISTIHAFCASVLREYPIQSGLDPDFDVAEASEATLVAHDAVRRHLGEIGRRDPDTHREAGALRRLLEVYRRRELTLVLRELLEERDFAHAWRGSRRRRPPSLDEVRAAHAERIRETGRRMRIAVSDLELHRIIDVTPAGKRDSLVEPLQAAIPLAHVLLDDELDEAMLVASRKTLLRSSGDARSFSKAGQQKTWGAGLTALRGALTTLSRSLNEASDWFRPWNEELERLALDLEEDLSVLSEGIEAHYVNLLGARRRTDFAGLELAVDRLLADDVVAQRVQERIRYLMVDEFQDTNHVQWSILSRILTAGGANAPEEGALLTASSGPNFFAVGDEKQAIYEFRGGRVEIFHEAERWVRARGGEVVSMADNYRTLPEPLAVVNEVFSHVFVDTDADYEARPQSLVAHRSGGTGRVALWLTDPDDTEDEPTRIARRLRDAMNDGLTVLDDDGERPAEWSDVAVIVFFRRFLPDLRDALTRLDIPSTLLGGRGFYSQSEVRDTVAMLTALTDPRDDVAFATLLRSPMVGVSDDDLWRFSRLEIESGWWDRFRQCVADGGPLDLPDARGALDRLEGWRKRVGTVPTATLLYEAFFETGYAASIAAAPDGDRRLAAIEKVLDLTRRFERRHGIRPAEVAADFRDRGRTDVDDGEATESDVTGGVTLTTIHQAKGCEYPIVVVPDLLGQPRRSDGLPFIRRHDLRSAELALKVPAPAGSEEAKRDELVPTFRHTLMHERETERDRAERKRVLYVAMTRARDHLFLSSITTKGRPRGCALEWLDAVPAVTGALTDSTVTAIAVGGTTLPVLREEEETQPLAVSESRVLAKVEAALDATSGAAIAPPPPIAPIPIVEPPRYTVSALSKVAASPRAFFTALAKEAEPEDEAREELETTLIGGAELGRRVHQELASSTDESTDQLPESVAAHLRSFAASPFADESRRAGLSWTEVPFRLVTPGGHVEGMIDRVYGDGDRWTIVDYKTNRLASNRGPAFVTAANAYDVQVMLYAVAWATLRSLDPGAVIRSVVFFTDPDQTGERAVVEEARVADLPSVNALGDALAALTEAIRSGEPAAFPERSLRTRPSPDDLLHWQQTAQSAGV